MQEIKVERNTQSEQLEKFVMLAQRIVDGGSCGGPDDCHVPGWLHDMLVEAIEDVRGKRGPF